MASSAAMPYCQAADGRHVSVLPSLLLIDHLAGAVPERPELDDLRVATCANGACPSRKAVPRWVRGLDGQIRGTS